MLDVQVMDTSADTLRDCFQLLFEKAAWIGMAYRECPRTCLTYRQDQDGCCDGNLQGRQSTDSARVSARDAVHAATLRTRTWGCMAVLLLL